MAWSNALVNDPLLIKEIRTRMRARTVVVVELLYIIGICGIVFLGFLVAGARESSPGWEMGASLFSTITYMQAIIMFFVSPLVAASAISGEKEQKTFDSLCVTPLSVRRLVLTKLLAALSCFLVLIIVSLPFACASFIMGGVAPADLVIAYALTLLVTAAAGAMGLYWSCRFERSIASIPAAAVMVILVMLFGKILADMGCQSIAAVSPQVFLNMLFEAADIPFYGGMCPFWIPSALLLVLLSAYFVTFSIMLLQFPKERRYVWLRCLTFLLFVSAMAFYVGENAPIGPNPSEARSQLVTIISVVLVSLAASAPWLGANLPVYHSERDQRVHPTSAPRLIPMILTHPIGFTVLLIVGAAPFIAVAMMLLSPLRAVPELTILYYGGVLGLSTVTWTLLSWRLANRRTTKGRFIGMAIAYVLMTILLLVPFIVLMAVRWKGESAPAWFQFASLLSPLTSLEVLGNPMNARIVLSAVMNTGGQFSPMLLTCGFFLLMIIVLWLPIYRRPEKR